MAMEQEKEELEEELELFGGGVRASDCRCWPSAGDLAFFRIVEAVFPVTDFRHPVVSPSQLLLGQYLAQCPIRGPRDVVACLCTAQLLVDFCRGAERLPGEAFLSVDALLNQAFPAKKSTSSNLDEAEKLDLAKRRVCPQMIKAGRCGVRSEHLDWLRKAKISKEAQPLSLTALRYDEDDTEDVSHVDNGVIVQSLLSLAQQLGHMAAISPVGDSLLQGIDAALQRAKGEEAKTISDVVSRDVKHVKASRKPMRLLDVQARAIKSIRPLFNENYKWTKDGHDPDRARAELKKLKRQAHRERKGVARELRKDAQFLAEQRETENQSRVSALRAERQRNFAELTNQAGEMNKAVREFGATGGGSRNVDMRGRRRQTRQ
mmetsp:Transcript_1110/g.1853  ORF Transcript_1110/g.1853 Transcript_1110/m.1853 type:complete len:376 (+) Transcript_1110:61-1188(+)